MKLTPEQQKALEEAMQERFPRTDMPTLPGEEAAFLAGCRYQHAATLERAAKVCDGQHWLRAFANAIRALTLDEC